MTVLTLPAGWQEMAIGDCVLETRSGASLKPTDFTDNGFPVLHKGTIRQFGQLVLERNRKSHTSDEFASSKQNSIVSGEYVVVTLRDLVPSGPTIGMAAKVRHGSEYLLAQGAYGFRFDESKIDRNFFVYLTNVPVYRSKIRRIMVGSTQVHVRNSDYIRMTIPLPSLSEQKRIADILDKADTIRRKRQEAVRISEDILLKSAFRSALGDPSSNPHKWPVWRLGEVINFVGGSQPPKSTFVSTPRSGYVRLVQIRDFKSDKYPTYIPKEFAKRPFNSDDVMIARYGPPVFQILRGLEGTYNVALMKAENTKQTTKDFIFYLLQIPEIHDFVVAHSERTAGQSGTNLELLRNLEVPIPPVEMQKEITANLQKIEHYISTSNKCQSKSDHLFDSLVQRAFKGEL